MAGWDFGYWREACGITCIIFSTRLVIGWRFSAGLVEGLWDPGFDFDSVLWKTLSITSGCIDSLNISPQLSHRKFRALFLFFQPFCKTFSPKVSP